MEINALEQIVRPESNTGANTRRSSDADRNRFSNLLDVKSERPRSERQAPSKIDAKSRDDDDRQTRAERTDRAERKARADLDDKPRDVAKTDRPDPTRQSRKTAASDGTKDAKAADDKAAADETAAASDKPADDDAAAADAAAAQTVVAVETPAAKPDAPAETQVPDAALALAIAAKFAVEMAKIPAGGEAVKEALAAVKGGDAKKQGTDATQNAVDQIAKPTATLAQQAAQAAAEPGEDYADFMLRNLASAPANAAAEASKDAAKADADAKQGALIVTIAQPAAIAAPVAPVTALAVQAVANNDNVTLDAIASADKRAAAAGEGADAKSAAKTAEPAAPFAQVLDQTRDAQAPAADKAATRAPLVPPHEQVAVHIRKAVSDGLDQITIRLNPVELGRIDVKLEVANDGSLRAAFAADRQATLEMLKGDSRQLEQALSAAGLRADSGGLNFSLRGDNRENAEAFRQMGEQFARSRGEDAANTDAPAPVAAASYARRGLGAGRVDLNA